MREMSASNLGNPSKHDFWARARPPRDPHAHPKAKVAHPKAKVGNPKAKVENEQKPWVLSPNPKVSHRKAKVGYPSPNADDGTRDHSGNGKTSLLGDEIPPLEPLFQPNSSEIIVERAGHGLFSGISWWLSVDCGSWTPWPSAAPAFRRTAKSESERLISGEHNSKS